jgi:hypothetical protein
MSENNQSNQDKNTDNSTFKDSTRFHQLETLLKCPKCDQIFLDPVTLFCQHTFCQSCIILNNKEDEIKCMICQQDNILPVSGNYQLKGIIEKIYDENFFSDRKKKFEEYLNKNIKTKKKFEIYKNSFNESIKNVREINGQFIVNKPDIGYATWNL